MSILGNIFNKIFHPSAAPTAPAPHQPQTQAAPASPQPAQQSAQPAAVPAHQVDVEAALSQMAAQHGGGGNWRSSIVDLLKLLELDSSLDARKELANELNIHVGADGSAEQNIALHKAVMQAVAANGGKVPDSLKN